MSRAPQGPSAIEILQTIEDKGFRLTLEERGTAQKWVTGRNLFLGLLDPHGMTVRDAYGRVSVEIPLAVRDMLLWMADDGTELVALDQALANTIRLGRIRRNSALYNALLMLAPLARVQ